MLSPSTANEINEKSNTLIEEFYEHFDTCKKNNNEEKLDQRVVFEGWMIQKIASLQFLVEKLNLQLNLQSNGSLRKHGKNQ